MRPRFWQPLTGRDRVALVGEAGGFSNTSSAEGLSFALKSAQALAASLNEGLTGFQGPYRAMVRILKGSIAFKGVKNLVMYHQTLRGLVMRTGILSSEVYAGAR